MIRTLLNRFSVRRSNETLADILSQKETQDLLLGVSRVPYPTDEENLRAADRVIRHSQTEDYAEWAKEIWASVVSCVGRLTDEKVSGDEALFYRGVLAAHLDALKLAHNARQVKETKRAELKQA